MLLLEFAWMLRGGSLLSTRHPRGCSCLREARLRLRTSGCVLVRACVQARGEAMVCNAARASHGASSMCRVWCFEGYHQRASTRLFFVLCCVGVGGLRNYRLAELVSALVWEVSFRCKNNCKGCKSAWERIEASPIATVKASIRLSRLR